MAGISGDTSTQWGTKISGRCVWKENSLCAGSGFQSVSNWSQEEVAVSHQQETDLNSEETKHPLFVSSGYYHTVT